MNFIYRLITHIGRITCTISFTTLVPHLSRLHASQNGRNETDEQCCMLWSMSKDIKFSRPPCLTTSFTYSSPHTTPALKQHLVIPSHHQYLHTSTASIQICYYWTVRPNQAPTASLPVHDRVCLLHATSPHERLLHPVYRLASPSSHQDSNAASAIDTDLKRLNDMSIPGAQNQPFRQEWTIQCLPWTVGQTSELRVISSSKLQLTMFLWPSRNVRAEIRHRSLWERSLQMLWKERQWNPLLQQNSRILCRQTKRNFW
jgi:hypothetical protein